jgi:hypothetical protein
MLYVVNSASVSQTISNFSVLGLTDPNNCFVDDTAFSISIVPNTTAISLYNGTNVIVKTSNYTDIGNYTVTVT